MDGWMDVVVQLKVSHQPPEDPKNVVYRHQNDNDLTALLLMMMMIMTPLPESHRLDI